MTLNFELQVTGEVLLAMFFGGLIGFDREQANKPAGLRTHMLVAGAAALLVGLSHVLVEGIALQGEKVTVDPIRIIEAIVTGVSFIGAGTILRRDRKEQVEGLTTAASLLMCAATGVCVALRQFVLATGVTLLTLLVLRVLGVLDKWIAKK